MELINLKEAPKVPIDRDGHILCKQRNIEIVHLNLKPGEKIEPHVNPVNVIFYVLEGKALLENEDKHVLVKKDDCIQVPAGTYRSLDNISVSNFKVMVIKLLA
ncbi:MAG TPA: cupin domain-containing protein [Lentimicrobium sp.]|nr:cupin domain-containing protein [Lentimicrobium sp.]